MYSKIIENRKYFLFLLLFFITLVNLIAWYPNFGINFLNDDYQIISIHHPKSIIDCFTPFFSTDILGSYWRPAVNTLHRIIIYFWGFNPEIFHFTNWLIYVIVCFLFGELIYKLDFKKYAIPSAILFSILPAHEIVVGWLSGRNETFMLIFLLINAIILLKKEISLTKEIIYYLCFLLAILTKESAYIAAFMPLLFYIYHYGFNLEKKKYKKFIRFVLISLSLIGLTIFYRLTIIGSNPAESSHFANLEFGNMIRNLLVAFPLSFLTADNTELFASLFMDKYFLAIIGLFALFVLLSLFKYLQYFYQIKDFRKIVFGLMWFFLFIIPPLPNMMRWYVLTASIGLIISIISFISEYKKNFKLGTLGKILNISFFIIIVLILSRINSDKMQDWVETSIKTQNAIKSIGSLELIGIKTLYLWAAPDKIERINSMKLGIEHSINYINKTSFNIINPLKAEISRTSHIKAELNDSLWKFEVNYARFLPFKGKSMYFIKNEIYDLKDDYYSMKIETIANDSVFSSKVIIKYVSTDSSTAHIYFNGDKFIRIK